MDVGKWDQIFLTNEQCLSLLDFVDIDENREELANYDCYPLRRFVLITENAGVKGSTFYHFFIFAGEHLDVRTMIEMEGKSYDAFSFSVDMVKFKLKKKSGIAVEKVDQKVINDLEYWAWLMLEFMIINTYILSDPEKMVDVEEKEVKEHETHEGLHPVEKKQKKRGKVRLVRSYRLKKRWKTVMKRRIQQITCPAWGVRGHYRHYKNGKTVFIQPYVKGKKRDEYRGKIYELMA